MPDIKYKLVDGEPICSQEECPSFHKSGWEQVQPSTCSQPDGDPFGTCEPGLRQQRDEARRELAEYEREPEIDISVWPKDIQQQVRKVLARGGRMVR